MTISARPLNLLRASVPLGCAVALLLFAVLAAPAGAVVTKVGSVTVGLQPNDESFLLDGPFKRNELNEAEEEPEPFTFANAAGNPVVHGSNVYAIYWDPTDRYHGDWQEIIDGFLHNAAGEANSLRNLFAVDEQYTDQTNVPAYNRISFRGAYTDTTAYPIALQCSDPHPLHEYARYQTKAIACLTDTQMQTELQSFITSHSLPRGMNTIYYLLTPPGVTVCLDAGGASGHCSDFAQSSEEEELHLSEAASAPGLFHVFEGESYEHGFCSYHSDINPDLTTTGDANTVLYGVIPWTAGGLGDGQLAARDETKSFYCQDGGFNPGSKPIEQHEELKKRVIQEPNQVPCPSVDGFCDAGLADLIVNQIGAEQQDIVTNPLLNAWQDKTGKEATDECRNYFEPPLAGSYTANPESGVGTLADQLINGRYYYINGTFNRAGLLLNYPGHACLNAVALDPKFTSPENVASGEAVGFDGMESTVSLGAATTFAEGKPKNNYATFTWNFGDGSPAVTGYAPGAEVCPEPWLPPCAASVFHTYTYGGTYPVSLTVTDVAGNQASVINSVTVIGPPPPAPEPPAGSGGSSGTTGSGSTTSGSTGAGASTSGTGSTGTVASAPVATATILSRSLKTAARKGLAVGYSVNEQVTGRFEVMLSRGVAKRLGIAGASAAGLSAQVVIAKAILITTKAGRGKLVIHFSKKTAGRLLRSHKVTLTLRLVVRNAASHSPTSATVVSAATLAH